MSKRISLNFWLLLAATFAVDALAVLWLSQDSNRVAAAVLFGALAFSQLSVITIWWSLSQHNRIVSLWGWTALPLAVLFAGAITSHIYDIPLREATVVYASHVALLAMLLWVAKQLDIFERYVVGSSTNWQFSVTNLLAVMTVVAVVIFSLQDTKVVRFAWDEFATAVITSTSIAIASVSVWLRRTDWLMSVVALLAAASILSAVIPLAISSIVYIVHGPIKRMDTPSFFPLLAAAGALDQSLVILVWLALGQFIHRENEGANRRAEKRAE